MFGSDAAGLVCGGFPASQPLTEGRDQMCGDARKDGYSVHHQSDVDTKAQ